MLILNLQFNGFQRFAMHAFILMSTITILYFLFIDVDNPILIVTGSSMESALSPGDAVLIYREDVANIEIGEVIAFKASIGSNTGQYDDKNNDVDLISDNKVIIHRVIEKKLADNGYVSLITKGDSNVEKDDMDVTNAEYLGTACLKLPKVGSLIQLIRDPIILVIFALMGVLSYFYLKS